MPHYGETEDSEEMDGEEEMGRMNMTNMEDLEAMKGMMAKLEDDDFKMLPDQNNLVSLKADDFTDLADEGEGAAVMLVIKGRVKNVGDTIDIDAFDAALVHGKLPKLGSGERFARLKAKLARRPGVTNPGALAAFLGRAKYGKSRFQKMALKGRMGH